LGQDSPKLAGLCQTYKNWASFYPTTAAFLAIPDKWLGIVLRKQEATYLRPRGKHVDQVCDIT
jgi:hypothetical protein